MNNSKYHHLFILENNSKTTFSQLVVSLSRVITQGAVYTNLSKCVNYFKHHDVREVRHNRTYNLVYFYSIMYMTALSA